MILRTLRASVLPLVLLGLLCSVVVARATATGQTPAAPSPQDKMAPGAGKVPTFRSCSDCHAIEQALIQRRSRPEWVEMIDKMVSQGASIKDDEYDVILAYLSGNYGKSIKINEATALQIQTLLDIPAAQAAAIVAHRTEHGKFATFDDLANVPGVSKERLAEEKLNFDFGG